ncbi:hypothetical protein COL26b_010389 [Colletotrichum chrysophilum]|uniref:uncharacterized protein n=1 Tax=Colletotrichum chrysophilum TaxID=1836956 RepID=UPI002301E651|nr:uncharacterized protein COL26b_010389 [Colletotrichum chrysophilum]KAJ0369694.1 hypothetical protein COL26b_010389 [Colletotrichum chrysophilum]
MGAMDWKYVGNEMHRRKCRGKESKVYLSGIRLRPKTIERGVLRYCYETAIEKAMCRKMYPNRPCRKISRFSCVHQRLKR